MKRLSLVMFLLSGLMATVGILGALRTGSMVPVLILGGMALVTLILGLAIGRGSRPALQINLAWLTMNSVVTGYQVFFKNPAHGEPRAGSALIFAVLTVACLAALAMAFQTYRRPLAERGSYATSER